MVLIDIEEIEAADRISRLSDDVLLTVNDEAAIFLRLSVSTLAKLRRQRSALGPPYVQRCPKGARGWNQVVRYRLGDLRAWRTANTVVSTHHAAKITGQV